MEGATPAPIIDSHIHLFPNRLFDAVWKWFDDHAWPIQYKIYADEVVEQLSQHGIDRFLVLNYAHKAGISASLNEWTHQFCRKYPQAVPLGTIHPDDENRDTLLERCFTDYGFYGLKFHTHVASIRPDDERMFPIYEKLIEHDKILVLHAGNGPSLHGYKETTKQVSGAEFVATVLERYPELKLIIPHLGAEEFTDFFQLMEQYPNLWMDTTMVVGGFFPHPIMWDQIERFADRILYGSDFPNIPYDLMTEVRAIQDSPLSDAAKANLLYGNAQRLLQLPTHG